MKLRHTAALLLVGWCFPISPERGKTVSNDLPADMPLAFTLEEYLIMKCGFSTKDECEKAAAQWQRDFYADADKNGQRVAAPPFLSGRPVAVDLVNDGWTDIFRNNIASGFVLSSERAQAAPEDLALRAELARCARAWRQTSSCTT
jgi:hypothetical protein